MLEGTVKKNRRGRQNGSLLNWSDKIPPECLKGQTNASKGKRNAGNGNQNVRKAI